MNAVLKSVTRSVPPLDTQLIDVVHEIAAIVRSNGKQRAVVVAMSGIDGSGKTRLSTQLAAKIEAAGLKTALIGVDAWQHPQTVRLGGGGSGVHFYKHSIRFADLFAQVVEPIRVQRSLQLRTRGIRTDSDVPFDLVYDLRDVDVILLEGIFLFRRDLVDRYDLRVWVECSFETALQRAVERNVEKLPSKQLMMDYKTIYHAAQRHHFSVDAPRRSADIVLLNDLELENTP